MFLLNAKVMQVIYHRKNSIVNTSFVDNIVEHTYCRYPRCCQSFETMYSSAILNLK